jgi:peroxiredoxin Q/BCP
MVELRKRKTPPPAPVRPAKRAAAPRGKKTAAADKKTAAADKKAAAADKTPVEKATKVASETVEAVTEAVSEAVEAVKEAVTGTDSANGNGTAAPAAALKVGDTIDLATFGGEVETHDGTKTTLKQLVEASKGGVVLFTYPKASTPGCKFAPAPAPAPTTPLHTLTRRRHHPGLPLPRLVHAPHCNGLRHLWSVQR